MRVLLDANILLRTLLPSPNPNRAVAVIMDAAFDGVFTLLLPPELLAEIMDKATTKLYKDDYLMAYADVSNAHYLVSGDKDVQELDDSALPFAIVTPAEFLTILRNGNLI